MFDENVELDSTSITNRFDCWTENWNQESPDEVRSRFVDFLNTWRQTAENWFAEESRQFYEQLNKHTEYEVPTDRSLETELYQLHLANHAIWHFEDEARRDDTDNRRIVLLKRGIDAVNQLRNNCMERLDELVIQAVGGPDEGPVHTEPPGLMVDRLSILTLKQFFYQGQNRTQEVDRLVEQRSDLSDAFNRVLNKVNDGELRFKIYRQLKTYNDPDLNPALEGPGGLNCE